MGELLLSRCSMRLQARSSGRSAHIRSSTLYYVIKIHDLDNHSMIIQLFNSVNNSTCMKLHYPPPFKRGLCNLNVTFIYSMMLLNMLLISAARSFRGTLFLSFKWLYYTNKSLKVMSMKMTLNFHCVCFIVCRWRAVTFLIRVC